MGARKGAEMGGKTGISRIFGAVLAGVLLTLGGCQNGNLFGKLHDSGDSGDTATLLSDGDQALSAKDYSRALTLYDRVLAKDDHNSRALYGAAAAQIGLSGLDFGRLLTNLLNHDGTASSQSLAEAIADYTVGFGALSNADANSILRGFNLDQLAPLTRSAINDLKEILQGRADGVIPSNDVASYLDFSICSIINAATTLLNANVCDIVNDNGTFKLVAKTSANAFCSDPSNNATVIQAGRDLCNAYEGLNLAAGRLGGGNSVITTFRDDVDKLIDESLDADGINDLDPACVSVLSSGGITHSNYRTAGDL